MSDEITSDQTVDYIPESDKPKRPTFLTVLCIITFVVSGYYVLQSVFSLFITESVDSGQWQEISSQMSEAVEDADPQSREFIQKIMTSASQVVQASIENALALGIAAFVASGLSLFGAILMFKLRKTGFYLYIASKLIGIIVPMAFLGFNMLTGLMYGFIGFIALIFIILYGVNTKYMR